MDCLMKAANDKTKSYIYNFVLDFFNLSSETLEYFYNIKNEKRKNRKYKRNCLEIEDVSWD